MVVPTPIPYKKLLPLCIIYFIEAFVLTNIFSYIGFMVRDFHLTDDPDKVGYYAGYLGSMFSIAGFLSSFWWGRLSDKYGRRPVLIFGCFGGLISTLLFGFSTSYEMAIATRFAAGLLNGNIGVVKGYAADICDKTNQVKGVGVMQLSWGLGNIIGPLIGGVLSSPCPDYCSENSLFGKFPYLLPNLFSCVVSVIAIITLIIYLPKTERKQNIAMKRISSTTFAINDDEETSTSLALSPTLSRGDMTSSDGNLQASLLGRGDSSSPSSPALDVSGGKAILHGMTSSPLSREDSLSGGLLSPEKEHSLLAKISRYFKKKYAESSNSVFRNKLAMKTILAYSILGGAFTMYDEAFPLLVMNTKEDGGLNATTSDIGYVGAINGVSAVIIQIFIFFPVATRLGFVRLFRLGLILGALLFFNYPTFNKTVDNKILMWTCLTIATFIKVLCGQFAFSAATALVSNTCDVSQAGAVNGFSQSSVSLLRAFSPAIAGSVLAWGLTNGLGFPFNQYLIFILISVLLTVSLLLSFLLPRTLDFPYEAAQEIEILNNNDNNNEKERMLTHNDKVISIITKGRDNNNNDNEDIDEDFSVE